MMEGAPCRECVYYQKPSWYGRFVYHQFAERCLHPKERDPVGGSPTPCITVRVNDCNGMTSTLFRPKSVESEEASDGN